MALKELIYFVLGYYTLCWGSALWLKSILEGHDGYYFIRNRETFYSNFHLEVLLNPLMVYVFFLSLSKHWNMRFNVYLDFLKWRKLKTPLDTKTILLIKEEFGDLYDQEIDELNQYR